MLGFDAYIVKGLMVRTPVYALGILDGAQFVEKQYKSFAWETNR